MTRDVNLYGNLFHLHRVKVETDVARLRVQRHTKNFTSVLRWPAYRNDRRHRTDRLLSWKWAWSVPRRVTGRRRISPDRRVLSRMKGIVFLSRKKVRRVSSSSMRRWIEHRHFYEGNSIDCPTIEQCEISEIISHSLIEFPSFVTFFLENKKRKKEIILGFWNESGIHVRRYTYVTETGLLLSLYPVICHF